VVVSDDQLSLAIGKRGQNARLAAKLVGWKVDIKSTSELQREAQATLSELMAAPVPAASEEAAPVPEAADDLTALPGVGEKLAARLTAAGFGTLAGLADASSEALQAVEGIGAKSAERIVQAAREALAEVVTSGPPEETPAAEEPR
jgi:N utilization substance protein A